MTVYDFDTGINGDSVEQLTVPSYSYYRTPLSPSSGTSITSNIDVDPDAYTFTSTAQGQSSDNPTDPQTLTDAQASNGVQLFFRALHGYIEAQYAVQSRDSSCTGRNLFFAGDSALC